MPNYTLVNRRGGKRSWYAYNGNDSVAPGWNAETGLGGRSPGHHGPPWGWVARYYASEDIADGASRTVSLPQDTMKFYIEGSDTVGPYLMPGGHHLIITPSTDTTKILVDLEQAISTADAGVRGELPPSPAEAEDDDAVLEAVLTITIVLLDGLATGLSAAGASFALGAGATTFVSGMLGTVMPQDEAPPPAPKLEAIQQAMRDVLRQQAAQEAATFFTTNYSWFSGWGQQIAAFGKAGKDIPDTLMDSFHENLRDALSPSNKDSFYNQLVYVSQHPEIGQYLLGQLLLATGLFVNLRRLEIAQIYVPAAQRGQKTVPVSVVSDLVDQTQDIRDGIANARDRFAATRTSYLDASGLSGTPEAIYILKTVSKAYAGDPYAVQDSGYAGRFTTGSPLLPGGAGYAGNADKVADALAKLDTVLTLLKQDVQTVTAGGWPQRLLNVAW